MNKATKPWKCLLFWTAVFLTVSPGYGKIHVIRDESLLDRQHAEILADPEALIDVRFSGAKNQIWRQGVALQSVEPSQVLQIRIDRRKPNLLLRDLTFENYARIDILLEAPARITITNCRFRNTGTLRCLYHDHGGTGATPVILENCLFEDTDLNNPESSSWSFLVLEAASGSSAAVIGEVEIRHNRFLAMDTSYSRARAGNGIEAAQRFGVRLTRRHERISLQDITISDNTFLFQAPHFKTKGIVISNGAGDWQSGPVEPFWQHNHALSITGNILNTDAENPGHGIFIHGPFYKVVISDNQMTDFGDNFLTERTDHVHADGALRFYGARPGKGGQNKGPFRDIQVTKNKIRTRSRGILIDSVLDSCRVSENVIEMRSEGDWWQSTTWLQSLFREDWAAIKIATGDPTRTEWSSHGIEVSHNHILCQGDRLPDRIGIEAHGVQNLLIHDNHIQEPSSYGIVVWRHAGMMVPSIGNTSISNNRIEFNQKNGFHSAFILDELAKVDKDPEFAAIIFFRQELKENHVLAAEHPDTLRIENNTCQSPAAAVPTVFIPIASRLNKPADLMLVKGNEREDGSN